MKSFFNKYLFVFVLSFFSYISVFNKTIENYNAVLLGCNKEQVYELKHDSSSFNLVVDTEFFKENNDIIEIEIEEDESLSKKNLNNFRFSDAYLSTNVLENQTSVINNGLTSCNYEKYLTSTYPLNVKFSVYRI
jgi:hypothetical protein